MKILAIVGSLRKKNTFEAVKSLKKPIKTIPMMLNMNIFS